MSLKSKILLSSNNYRERNSDLHDYEGLNDKTPPKPPRSLKSPKNQVKSRLYEGNATYKKRLEESKKMIEDKKRKEIASPKRFQIGNKSPAGSPSSKQHNLKSRPPLGSNVPVATTDKIRNAGSYKKVEDSKGRKNFKSPNAVRKTPLISSENPASARNNISASKAGNRRTRGERKAVVEHDHQVNKGPSNFYERKYHHPDMPELAQTLNSTELQLQECPMPTPVPQRFAQEANSKRFSSLEENFANLQLRHDLEDESNLDFQEEQASLFNKLPMERQSITNSKVFSMSETQFAKFDLDNEIEDYIEVAGEEEFVPTIDDIQYEAL